MRNRWRTAVRSILSDNRLVPIIIAAALTLLAILILWALSPWYGGQPGDILRGIYIEATGAAMDIVVFGFILVLLAYWTNRRREARSCAQRVHAPFGDGTVATRLSSA